MGGGVENSQLFRLVGGICRSVKLVPLVRCPGEYKTTFNESEWVWFVCCHSVTVTLVVGCVSGGGLLTWENVVCPGWLEGETCVSQWCDVV